MDRFSLLDPLTDVALVHGLKACRSREQIALADVLAHIAKVEERKLHVPAGYGSMLDYCVHELHYSKDAAYKRIHAARAALDHPAILDLVAEGALGLRVVNHLAPYLTDENAGELLAAAALKAQDEVRELLAERFPQGAVETIIEPVGQPLELAPADGEEQVPAAEQVCRPVQEVVNPPQCTPLAADLYKLQLTMTGAMYQKLRHALDLCGRRKPIPDEAEILELGLDLLVAKLEKKKFAATDRPRSPRAGSAADHIPAHVQREVWERDGGRCTFGKQFMEQKREQARAAAARRKAEKEAERVQARAAAAERRKAEKAAARAAAEAAEKAAREAREHDEFLWWMELLGYSAADSEFAAAHCPRRPGQAPETQRLECMAFLQKRARLASTGT